MTTNKNSNLSVVSTIMPSSKRREELMESINERLGKERAEVSPVDVKQQVEARVARDRATYGDAKYDNLDQMFKEQTKNYNHMDGMKAQIMLSQTENNTRLIDGIEHKDRQFEELLRLHLDLQQEHEAEINSHASTKNALNELMYSKESLFERIKLASLGILWREKA